MTDIAPTQAITAPPKSLARLGGNHVPLLIVIGSLVAYVIAALVTGQTAQLSLDGFIGILQRTVALGLVALGQTLVILVRSIDLSVATLVSVGAVMASWVMQGDPAMMIPATLFVLALSAAVGVINGLIVTQLKVNPLIATLGVGLVLQGILSASFNDFAGSVPKDFQVFAYGTVGPVTVSIILMFVLAVLEWLMLSRTRFGAHIYATGGNQDGARLAGIKTGRVTVMAHVLGSLAAGLSGLYLASRLRSGAPWVGRDGVYDLESIAVVVIGGTILAGGKGGVWGTIAGVILFGCLDAIFTMAGVDAYIKQVLRGAIVVAAVAAYAYRTKGHVA
jgi:ribose transport system permease protein